MRLAFFFIWGPLSLATPSLGKVSTLLWVCHSLVSEPVAVHEDIENACGQLSFIMTHFCPFSLVVEVLSGICRQTRHICHFISLTTHCKLRRSSRSSLTHVLNARAVSRVYSVTHSCMTEATSQERCGRQLPPISKGYVEVAVLSRNELYDSLPNSGTNKMGKGEPDLRFQ